MNEDEIFICFLSAAIIVLAIFLFALQANQCREYMFIENASDGMTFRLGRCDILLVGKGVYEKLNRNNGTVRISLCEECGTKNDCLGNNLRMLDMINNVSDADVISRYGATEGARIIQNNRMLREINFSASDLVSFYVYPLTYSKLESIRRPGETMYQAYSRYSDDCQA